jgi:hypothetical protein
MGTRNRIAFLILILLVFAASVFLVVDRYATGKRLQALPENQTLKLEIPDSPWERTFFEQLEERTKAVNLPQLRTVVLPEDDLEVRFWYDRFEIISGVVIRRTGQQWSANWIYQMKDHLPSSAKIATLNPPKSGWEVFWKNLVETGILTLPDQPRPQCPTEALDGVGYITETNVAHKYRTYRYGNPHLMKCSEAKQMLQIEEIIREEFSLHDWIPALTR